MELLPFVLDVPARAVAFDDGVRPPPSSIKSIFPIDKIAGICYLISGGSSSTNRLIYGLTGVRKNRAATPFFVVNTITYNTELIEIVYIGATLHFFRIPLIDNRLYLCYNFSGVSDWVPCLSSDLGACRGIAGTFCRSREVSSEVLADSSTCAAITDRVSLV